MPEEMLHSCKALRRLVYTCVAFCDYEILCLNIFSGSSFSFIVLLGFDYLQELTGEAQIQLKTAAEKHWSDGALDVITTT